MSGLKFARALAGVSKGVINGLKLQDKQKASMLNNMLVQQNIAKNKAEIKRIRTDELKKQQKLEMEKLTQAAELTGDYSEINQLLEKLHLPFKFSAQAAKGKDGTETVDILDDQGTVLKQGIATDEALNSMYRSVTGKNLDSYEYARKQRDKQLAADRALQRAKELKQTAPGIDPSAKARNYASANANQSLATKHTVDALNALDKGGNGGQDGDGGKEKAKKSLLRHWSTKK